VPVILPLWLLTRQGRTTVTAVIRRSFRIGLTLGLLGGVAFAVAKMLGARPHPAVAATPPATAAWPRLTPEPVAVEEPAPVRKAPAKKAPAKKATERAPAKAKTPVARWVEPVGDVCPTSHPVKAKLASKIFHLPGMLNYTRTRPDRCYQDATAAESDGLRPAKR
jgi:hypothetical protein